MNKIHVITKYFYPLQGGIEISMWETYSRLVRDGFEVTVHTSRDDYEGKAVFAEDEEINGLKIKRYETAWYGFWPKIAWGNADIITMHNFNIFPHLLIMIFTIWQKIIAKKNYLLVFQTHGGYMPRWSEFSWPAKIVKKIYHATLGQWMVNLTVDRVRAVSLWEEDELRHRGIKAQIIHIPSGIEDMAFFNKINAVSQADIKLAKNMGRYLIQVGKIKRSKNHATVIKSLKKLPADIKFVIVGQIMDIVYYNELLAMIKNLNLTNRVVFTGYIDTEKKYYLIKNAIAMVNLPPLECYGSTVYEAMARGAITIVGDKTAPGRLSIDNECGIAINPLNVQDVLTAIEFILDNKNLTKLQAMREKAKDAVSNHSWEAVSKSFNKLFVPYKIKTRFFTGKFKLAGFIVLCSLILLFTLRGLPGNPNAVELSSNKWSKGPFESSNDRGRFALTYSMIEDGSLHFSLPLAKFAAPDLAITDNGQYASLFVPGVSFLIIPGYLIGKFFGAAQFGSYAVIALFALINVFLIRAISIKLGAHPIAAALAALTFIFATPAYTYAVTLSQHHLSVFCALLSIYLLLYFKSWWSLALVWFLCACSVIIDNPNFFLMFPIGLYSLSRIFVINRQPPASFKIKYIYMATIAVMIIPIIFFTWFNNNSNGNPLKLSGALTRVLEINENGKPVEPDQNSIVAISEKNTEKNPIKFFETRNLLNGFFTHLISPDRGIINYTPVILLGLIGFIYFYRSNKTLANLLAAMIGLNILLYSMWADPWGGWSFGSRYLIPTYALLSITLSLAITYWKNNIIIIAIFLIIFSHSAWINSIGALSTNLIPPQVEVLALEKITQQVEKFTYDRSYDFLKQTGSKSFFWQNYFQHKISAVTYQHFIFGIIIALAFLLVIRLWLLSQSIYIFSSKHFKYQFYDYQKKIKDNINYSFNLLSMFIKKYVPARRK